MPSADLGEGREGRRYSQTAHASLRSPIFDYLSRQKSVVSHLNFVLLVIQEMATLQ